MGPDSEHSHLPHLVQGNGYGWGFLSFGFGLAFGFPTMSELGVECSGISWYLWSRAGYLSGEVMCCP